MKITPAYKWVLSSEGKLKLNFNGASLGNPGPAGYGCFMKDAQGHIILVKGGRLGVVMPLKRNLLGYWQV